jgi:MFS family permease
MTETPHAPSEQAAASPRDDWLKVLIVTAGSFIMVTSEFLPVGLLTRIAADIQRTPGQLGLMVTVPGLIAGLAAPLSLVLLHRFDRRYVLIALTFLIAVADLIVATAGGFVIILSGRVLLGAAVGAFWCYASDVARRLVSRNRGNMAVAIVLGGISLGTVVGCRSGHISANLWLAPHLRGSGSLRWRGRGPPNCSAAVDHDPEPYRRARLWAARANPGTGAWLPGNQLGRPRPLRGLHVS